MLVNRKKQNRMATKLSKLEWIEILQSQEITHDLDLSIFQTLYSFENHNAPASQVGRILGYDEKSPHGAVNLEIGRYAKRIANHYEINFTERRSRKFKFWDLFFNGWDIGNRFTWQLREELKEALEETGLTGEVLYPEEIPKDEQSTLPEGLKRTILVNSYERNAKARIKCIEHWNAICCVCNFDFSEVYGETGKGFIHVHHLVPISEIGEEYEIDPIKDLRPVCPNCHSMLHIKNPPLTIVELKGIIEEQKIKITD